MATKKQEKVKPVEKPTEKPTEPTAPIKSKKKIIVILSIISVIVIAGILAAVLIPLFMDKLNINSNKIVDRLAEKVPSITNIEHYSEANDPNGILGKENQYTSKSSWMDSRLSDIVEDYAGTIEVFRNTKDAELRELKFKNSNEECYNSLPVAKYGQFMINNTCDKLGYGTTYRDGVVVIRISRSYDDDQLQEIKDVLKDIVSYFIQQESDVPSSERIDELRKENDENLKETFEVMKKTLDDGMNEILTDYQNRLAAILVSLNEDEYNAAKSELSFFKDGSYYSDKVAGLEQKLQEIGNKIQAKKNADAAAAKQKEAERLAAKNRTFGAGKYTTCQDIDAGKYDVKAISGRGNFFVHSDTYSHYVNEILHADGSYGRSTEYKNMILSCGDTVELTSSLKVQITAKN